MKAYVIAMTDVTAHSVAGDIQQLFCRHYPRILFFLKKVVWCKALKIKDLFRISNTWVERIFFSIWKLINNLYLFNRANRFPLNGLKQSFVNTILGLKRLTYKTIKFHTEIQVVLKSEIRINCFDWKLEVDSKTIW